jgi:hypothetical protein
VVRQALLDRLSADMSAGLVLVLLHRGRSWLRQVFESEFGGTR